MSQIRCVTFNANGLGDKLKIQKVMTWLKRYNPNIILLQETHCNDVRKGWYKNVWKGECIHSIGSSNSKGCSIFISSELDTKADIIVIFYIIVEDR